MKIEKKDIFDGIFYGLFINFGAVLFFLAWSFAEGKNKFSPELISTFIVIFFLAFALYIFVGNARKKLFNADRIKAQLKDKNELLKLIILLIILFLSLFLYKKQIIADYVFALILFVFSIITIFMVNHSKKKFG